MTFFFFNYVLWTIYGISPQQQFECTLSRFQSDPEVHIPMLPVWNMCKMTIAIHSLQWVYTAQCVNISSWWQLYRECQFRLYSCPMWCGDTDQLWLLFLHLYSLGGWTSYRNILWSLQAAGFQFWLVQSLWNLTGTSAATLPRCLSNFQPIRSLQHPIAQLQYFTRYGGKTSYCLVNINPGSHRRKAHNWQSNSEFT